jgi:hypothetical protein
MLWYLPVLFFHHRLWCYEPYHCTLDVCTMNKVRKYSGMYKTTVSLYTAIETQQQIFR